MYNCNFYKMLCLLISIEVLWIQEFDFQKSVDPLVLSVENCGWNHIQQVDLNVID